MTYRIIYMGTPFFASEVLKTLLTINEIEIVGVVTQPDRKIGRKKILTPSMVKEIALENNLPIFQPEKIKDIAHDLKELKADAIVTCAYGQFLPKVVLDATLLGVINVHASLLPKYRGGAPMQYAILNGDNETGITLMKSVLKMDAGDILVQDKVDIDFTETLSSLEPKLINCAQSLLINQLLPILKGEISPKTQDESKVTFSPTISADDERIQLDRLGLDIYNQCRALIDNPYAYLFINNKKVKLCEVTYTIKEHTDPLNTIISFDKYAFTIALDGGYLSVKRCQIEGKQQMSVDQLYNGYHSQWLGAVVHE